MPIGTLCKSAHRVKADDVMELVSQMIKEVIRYADVDREKFAGEIRADMEQKQTADFGAQKKRMAACEKRIGELEILIAKIYEDNALGRKAWTDSVNHALAERGFYETVDHRSYKRQGIEKIPTMHMGAAASQMKRRGISTGRGMENRRIAEQNRLLEETGRKIAGLCLYLKKLNEQKEDEGRGPTLADLFDAAMNRALRDGKRGDAIDFADARHS